MNEAQSEDEKKIKSLVQLGKFGEAINESVSFLQQHSDSVPISYMLAVSLRYEGQLDNAIQQCQKLIELSPEYGRAYQELGHCYKSKGEVQTAFTCYSQAVKFNPALIASWKQIVETAGADNDQMISQAKKALSHLQKLSPELQTVHSLIYEGDLLKAETICRHFLKRSPKHPEAMRLLANLGVKQAIIDDAEFILESCLEFHPDFHLARVDYVNVLHKRQKFKQAFEQASLLLSAEPENSAFKMLYAEQCVGLNKIDKAIRFYLEASQELSDNQVLWLMLGHAYKTQGDFTHAVKSYQKAYQCRADFGDAFWSLANLKTYQFSEQEFKLMLQAVETATTVNVDKFHMMFALGKAYEDLGNFKKSFEFYKKGNALKDAMSRYSKDENRRKIKRTFDAFSNDKILKYAEIDSGVTPIFIVGLPRAGSTLIEQILSSHSQIEGTLELANIITMAYQLSRVKLPNEEKVTGYPAIVKKLSKSQLGELGKQYLQETKIHRTDKPFFIDKMPNNFFHLGLILSILPHAKIIDARRSPMSCCFSGFKQLFAEGQEFSYSLENIADYYVQYEKLMTHWHQVYPGQILQVNYEDVVADIQPQVEQILQFIGVPYEEDCVAFYRTKRSVRTASAEQVRQPLYRSALEQWKNYQEYLTPLSNVFEKQF